MGLYGSYRPSDCPLQFFMRVFQNLAAEEGTAATVHSSLPWDPR